MRYWDTSAIVGLFVDEARSMALRAEHARDVEMTTWWGTQVECISAVARLEREERLTSALSGEIYLRLGKLAAGWVEVLPSERLRTTAERLLRVHPLRAGDALQLAAAIVVAEDHAASMPFVTADARLALAAQREGFEVIQPD